MDSDAFLPQVQSQYKDAESQPETQGQHALTGWTTEVQARPEMSVEEAARVLGLTTRTVINYLKSRQLQGQKVGKKWFVATSSVALLRPYGALLTEVQLPPLADPRSREQVEQSGGAWRRHKSRADLRGLAKLTAFSRLKDAHALFRMVESDFTDHSLRQFICDELTAMADEIGGGYYHFGSTKLRLYSRARSRAGRLVARMMLKDSPHGLLVAVIEAADSVAALCRRIARGAHPPAAEKMTSMRRKSEDAHKGVAIETHG